MVRLEAQSRTATSTAAHQQQHDPAAQRVLALRWEPGAHAPALCSHTSVPAGDSPELTAAALHCPLPAGPGALPRLMVRSSQCRTALGTALRQSCAERQSQRGAGSRGLGCYTALIIKTCETFVSSLALPALDGCSWAGRGCAEHHGAGRPQPCAPRVAHGSLNPHLCALTLSTRCFWEGTLQTLGPCLEDAQHEADTAHSCPHCASSSFYCLCAAMKSFYCLCAAMKRAALGAQTAVPAAERDTGAKLAGMMQPSWGKGTRGYRTTEHSLVLLSLRTAGQPLRSRGHDVPSSTRWHCPASSRALSARGSGAAGREQPQQGRQLGSEGRDKERGQGVGCGALGGRGRADGRRAGCGQEPRCALPCAAASPCARCGSET